MDIQYVDYLEDYNPDFSINKIRIDMHSTKNMLQIAVDNADVNKDFKELLANDYMLAEHIDGVSYFQKRKTLVFADPEMKSFEDLRYTIQDKIEQKAHRQSKLLVVFSHFSGDFGPHISKRMYFNIWPDVQKSLVKDTVVLRIMDYNLSHGSGYINTINFPDYERQVQDLITFVMEQQGIEKKNVVLWGSSKGGTGATYHALLGDYKLVAIDPILDEKWYIENKGDVHFVNGLRKTNLIDDINEMIEHSDYQFKKFIIANSHYSFNYEALQRMKSDKLISILDIDMPNAYDHLQVVGYNSKIQSLTLLNASLDEQIMNVLR